MAKEFDNAILYVTDKLKRALEFIPQEVKQNCQEIRLRKGLPVCLTVCGKVVFVCKNSTVCSTLPKDALVATKEDIQQTLSLLCNKSVYLHEGEIKQGYISLPRGNRAGVCGIFNAEGMLMWVSSINIRIARQVVGCAQHLLPYAKGGLLIAGPPGSGKTTILRDLIRLLSNGATQKFWRVAVIDSRYELSGGEALDLGVNTDILYTNDKAVGTQIALRTLYPDFIAFDEIGTVCEFQSVVDCFNAGVDVITTVHCNKKEDIMRRDVIKSIVQSAVVSHVALLPQIIGKTPEVFDVKELISGAYI